MVSARLRKSAHKVDDGRLVWGKIAIEPANGMALYLDGKYLGIQMWKPYTFDCDEALTAGTHTLRVEITAGLSSQPEEAPTTVKLQLT